MAHPRMYREDDPHLAHVRELCLSFPEATEVEAWGRPTFRAGKIFCIFSGADDHPFSLLFQADDDERPALLEDERSTSPPTTGARRGWPSTSTRPPSTGSSSASSSTPRTGGWPTSG